jgi:thioester reductase-like protein
MTNYLITGATGFLGRNVVPRLLARDPSAEIAALVRPGSVDRLNDLVTHWPGGDRVRPLVGDLEEPGLGLDADPDVDVVVHLGAIYDMTVGEEQASTNVEGTRAVVELTRRLGVTLHHVSSIAVAGDHTGPFDETDFDLGQGFPSPYHRTKFEAERGVRLSETKRTRLGRTLHFRRQGDVAGRAQPAGRMDMIDVEAGIVKPHRP